MILGLGEQRVLLDKGLGETGSWLTRQGLGETGSW